MSLENIKAPNIKVECRHDGAYWIQLADDEPNISIHPGDTVEVRWRLEYPRDGGPPKMNEVGNEDTISDTSPVNAPDSFVPLTGYRAWRITSEGFLRSTAHDYIWSPGEQTAECQQSINGHHISYHLFRLREQAKDDPATLAAIDQAMMDSRRSPERNCQCGFYALTDISKISSRVGNTPGLVYGRIKAWGKIAQYEDGFRAEKAEIEALYLPRGSGAWRRYKTKKIAKEYGVPTEKAPQGIPAPDDTAAILFALFWLGLIIVGGLGAWWAGGFGYVIAVGNYVAWILIGAVLYDKIVARLTS